MRQRIGGYYTRPSRWRTWGRAGCAASGGRKPAAERGRQLIKGEADVSRLARAEPAGKAERAVYALPLWPSRAVRAAGRMARRHKRCAICRCRKRHHEHAQLASGMTARGGAIAGWRMKEHWFQRRLPCGRVELLTALESCVTLNEKCIAVHKYLQERFLCTPAAMPIVLFWRVRSGGALSGALESVSDCRFRREKDCHVWMRVD